MICQHALFFETRSPSPDFNQGAGSQAVSRRPVGTQTNDIANGHHWYRSTIAAPEVTVYHVVEGPATGPLVLLTTAPSL